MGAYPPLRCGISYTIILCFHARDSTDKTPEQEILWLNNMLAECISANTLLMKENIQFKKTNNNLEQEIARLKSEKVKEEQLNPETIKEEPTSGNGLKQLVCIRYT